MIALEEGLISVPEGISLKDFLSNSITFPDSLPKDELIELSTAVKIKAKKMPDYSSDKKGVPHLYDCVLAFTGPLFTMSREEAVEKVRECGGRVVSNVTPLVNYVVSNETESSNKKFVTAKKLGIRIINEEEFKHLLEGTF